MKKKLLFYYFITLSIAMNIVFIATWFIAFLSPYDSVIITINNYYEKWLELFIIIIYIPLAIYYYKNYLDNFIENEKD